MHSNHDGDKKTSSDDDRDQVLFTFYDRVSSNNAARIRLWLRLRDEKVRNAVSVKFITHARQRLDIDKSLNPQGKIPLLLLHGKGSGGNESVSSLSESSVILEYLEDFLHENSNLFAAGKEDEMSRFIPRDPLAKAMMQLIIRTHDLYISSPNMSGMPVASDLMGINTHTQACLYIAPPNPDVVCDGSDLYLKSRLHAESVDEPKAASKEKRGLPIKVRALKALELFEQLKVVESLACKAGSGHFLVGNCLSLADLALFPTLLYVKYYAPLTLGWPAKYCLPPRLNQVYASLTGLDAFRESEKEMLELLQSEQRIKDNIERIVTDIKANGADFVFAYSFEHFY